MELSIITLIPPLLSIIMVIATKRVILSLGVGIISGAFLLEDFNIVGSLKVVFQSFVEIFYVDGAWELSNIYILSFLFLLGILTAFVSLSGGSRAFGNWALKRVKTKLGAQLLTVGLGFLFFIDDYFNALAVGQISRPITDRHKVSRAKLSYLIDSTSAPICVIAPISSWGAYIIMLITSVLAVNGITEFSGLTAFIHMIPMNFYAITTLSLVLLVVFFKADFGKMKEHEVLASQGQLFDAKKAVPGELKVDKQLNGGVSQLMFPVITLFVTTISAMIYTGYQAVGEFNLLGIFENTETNKSLFIGGVASVIVSFVLLISRLRKEKLDNSLGFVGKGVIQGLKSMVSAVLILIFAWALSSVISELQTGAYLASLVERFDVSVMWLPVLFFVISGFMAFSTGTSWGAFGILLPIAGSVAVSVDLAILLPAMAAVLAGAVFGDHCSPISDTTILSSTGAGSPLMDHVLTQLPYAALCAAISIVGFILLAATNSVWISLLICEILLVISLFIIVKIGNKKVNN